MAQYHHGPYKDKAKSGDAGNENKYAFRHDIVEDDRNENNGGGKSGDKKAGGYLNNYIVEPSAPELIAALIPQVLSQKLYTALTDSYASEHAARTMAMQVATDNADDLIQELTLQYNKSRQQSITAELLDIIGGTMK